MKATIIFLFLLAAGGVKAQPYFSVGVRGGGNTAGIDFDNIVNRPTRITSNVSGYQGGFIMRFVPQKNLGVQLEATYIRKGWKETFPDEPDKEENFLINYLKIPFCTYAYVGNKSKFFVLAGPYITYRLDGKRIVETNGVKQEFNYNYEKSRDNLFNYGLMAGAGISYDLGFGVIAVDARASFGMGNVLKPQIPEYDFTRYQTISISASYLIRLFGTENSPGQRQAD